MTAFRQGWATQARPNKNGAENRAIFKLDIETLKRPNRQVPLLAYRCRHL